MNGLSNDLLAHIAFFLTVSDLLSCSALFLSMHLSFDSDRVWRLRLPQSTAQSEAGSASCKSRYIALHACSEHEVQRCYRLLPLSEPVQRPTHWPIQLALRRLENKPIPPSPFPPVTALPLCRACTRAIADCELDRRPAISRRAYNEHWISCLVRLSRTEYDVRYSEADAGKGDLSIRCTIAPAVTARLLLSRFLPCFVGPADAGTIRYRCSAWKESWPRADHELLGMCAAQPADNVYWPGTCPRTAGRELYCNQHRASGCLSVLHHYERLPQRGVLLSRCDRCRISLSDAKYHCSLCLFHLCEACGEVARSDVYASDLLWDGAVMTMWTGNGTHASSSRQFVWWAPPEGVRRFGTLCWCDAAQPQLRWRSADRELPLHHISDVFFGRQSPALRSPQAAQQSTQSQCFSLASKRLTLSAQCDSAEAREQWLRELRRLYTQGGKVVDQQS